MEKGNELRRKDMRRKDREVTDAGKIREAIEDSHCCRLGFMMKERYISFP